MAGDEGGIVHGLLAITGFGSSWVLWLLVGMSIASIAVMFERLLYFRRTRVDFAKFRAELSAHLAGRRFDEAEKLSAATPAVECRIALEGLKHRDLGPDGMDRSMSSFLVSQRQFLDRGLVILGTLGNNTPFIGLFGTVLGIIQAFHSLSLNPTGGSQVVMAGISEALVATAVGLIVAIPAVIAFNGFQRIVKRRIANAQGIQELVMAYLGGLEATRDSSPRKISNN